MPTLVIPTVIVLLASAIPARAEVLGEIVVTARKYDVSPQDLPIAIAIFSGSSLQGASNVADEFDPADLVSRLEAQIIFQDLVTSEHYERARHVGERLVELTKAEFGEQSMEVAQVLEALAEIQRRAGEYDDAEENFLTSIEMIGDEDGMFSEHLIDPLIGLATNYRHAGDGLAAMIVYNEARSLSRRVFGLFNEGQIDILDQMSETLIEMSLFEDAHDQQVKALGLAERIQGTDSLELLPAIYKYAHWLRSLGWYTAERVQYVRAIDIVTEHSGQESPELAIPLRETANSFRAQRLGDGRGEGSLKRALSILEAQENIDKLAIAETLRDLGDWKVAFSKARMDGTEYTRAWKLLGDVESGEALRTEWFEQSDYVLFEQPNLRGLVNENSEPGAKPGFVLLVFDINERGRSENVVVVESSPPGLKDDAVARAVRQSRFRPGIRNGEIVRTTMVSHQVTFFYKPEEASTG
ncbi:MAG: TonB family protein [Gammaproteobacteria bacterium]|nr:TonB family protein [Gammaproteobacteria bacterium]